VMHCVERHCFCTVQCREALFEYCTVQRCTVCVVHSLERHCVCVLHSVENHSVCTAQSRGALCVYFTV